MTPQNQETIPVLHPDMQYDETTRTLQIAPTHAKRIRDLECALEICPEGVEVGVAIPFFPMATYRVERVEVIPPLQMPMTIYFPTAEALTRYFRNPLRVKQLENRDGDGI